MNEARAIFAASSARLALHPTRQKGSEATIMRSDDRYGQAFRKSLSLRMRELGLTQGDLALRMKTSRPYVNKALHGQINITFASAERFAKALNLDFLPQLVQPLSGKAYGVRVES